MRKCSCSPCLSGVNRLLPRPGSLWRLTGVAAFCIFAGNTASAHCFVGARLFPTTMTFDDPCVADEATLPNMIFTRNREGSQKPTLHEAAISVAMAKRLTDNFAVGVESGWMRRRNPGVSSVSGVDGLTTAAKYQFLTMRDQEFVMSADLAIQWGGVGRKALNIEPFHHIVPALNIGKGFGPLPDSLGWARPFAVTATLANAIPTWSRTVHTRWNDDMGGPVFLNDHHSGRLLYSASLQYSMSYLKANVYDFELPDFFNRLVPLLEISMDTTLSGSATPGARSRGIIAPGIVWTGNVMQLGVSAVIPINNQSGRGVGFQAQAHFFLDEILPHNIAKPVFASASFPPDFADKP